MSPGLIPASAGQTWRAGRAAYPRGAHPRECGADEQQALAERLAVGSSPRVRGRRCAMGVWRGGRGLIPASAGQTFGLTRGIRVVGAHPRECGADSNIDGYPGPYDGSSPRVRGRQRVGHFWALLVGLIPASAGQTRGCRCRMRLRWAHPRECGADMASRYSQVRYPGSSPRVRGRPARWC